MAASGYTFIYSKWDSDAPAIRQVREQVLVAEMGLSREQVDRADEAQAFHVLVYDAGGRAVGAARMQPDGCIDYVAVLRPWRGRTVGGALLAYLHHIAQVRRLEKIWSVVPDSARRFFEKNRFLPVDHVQPAGGIPGQKYVRMVQKPGSEPSALH
jgi:N-acetylglutamate synthase-like GNAT family acetyltransferase